MERTNQPLTNEAARKLMALDVQDKEILTYEKLDEWYTAWGGQCYVSFSGGKDSTVLAYLAARYLSSFRTPPWELNLVFVNTGLEYPEIQKFVNEYADWLRREFSRVTVNLVRLGPKMNIRQVVTKYGYSIVSKDVANCVWLARRSGNGTRMARLRGELLDKDGTPSAYNCENWAFLLDAPFLVSSECCRIMKKNTAHKYDVETKEKPIVATMADEGRRRFLTWTATGCNAFDGKRPMGQAHEFLDGAGCAAVYCGAWVALRQRVRRHRGQRRRERLRRDADRLQTALHGMPTHGLHVLWIWKSSRKRHKPI